ncbi:MAG: xanthine dehydrogenase family protein subunit M [Cyanobacteria bacterium SZAS LIN-2]|nr:xanthine dehydrogenase family protein subunit M [Cyanobacteria bacterium SZAS LIN-2]
MKLFTYAKAGATAESAIQEAAGKKGAYYIAGGTNIIDLMKDDVVVPDHLVDITALNCNQIEKIAGGGVKIGAMLSNSDLANDPYIRATYPVLSRAILSGASAQLRNMASVGGNLMQRTRCSYFYDVAGDCNKRKPGSGCPAIEGYNRMHSILGASNKCISAHPSDMCVALAALDATVHLAGPAGERKVKLLDFHKLPGNTPEIENVLAPHELIVAVELPPTPAAFGKNWCYLKVRDRASYAFALVSAAACLELEGGKIKSARLALGGVAPKPWRAADVEKMMVGKPADEKTFKAAAEAVMKSAKGYEHNKFKIELGKRTIVRALKVAAGGVA